LVELRARPELSFMPPLRGLAVESVAPLGLAPALGLGVLLGGGLLGGALDALHSSAIQGKERTWGKDRTGKPGRGEDARHAVVPVGGRQ
jgi:hypothetical protein